MKGTTNINGRISNPGVEPPDFDVDEVVESVEVVEVVEVEDWSGSAILINHASTPPAPYDKVLPAHTKSPFEI